MRRLGVWALGAVLLTGVGAATTFASDDDDASPDAPAKSPTKSGSSWNPFSGLFTSSDKSKDDKTSADATKKATSAKTKAHSDKDALLASEAKRKLAETARAKALQDYLRRLEVCDRLMQIALDTNDKELERRAKELEDRAAATLEQQRTHLPSFESDKQALQKHLSSASPEEASASSSKGYPDLKNDRAAEEDKP